MKIPHIVGGLSTKNRLRFFGESLAGCWVIALLGFSGYILHFNAAPIGFLFLLVVVSVAILCGFWQATIVSIVACTCLDYLFYPPYLTLNVDDPQDWVAIGVFEVSALVVSRLSTREQKSTREAAQQRTAMEHLYELGRSTLLLNLHQPPGLLLAQLIRRIFSVDAVSIFDSNSNLTDAVGSWGDDERDLAKECCVLDEDSEDPATQTLVRNLRVGTGSVGAIAIRGNLSPLVVNAVASLVAIALDRCASFEKENRIEAAHQSERLRAAVLDSLAHAVKTPLTAIQSAGSGLREVGTLNEAQVKLVSLVEEEAHELSLLCTRLLQTAALDADELSLGKADIAVTDLVERALLENGGQMAGHPVEVEVREPSLTIRGDSDLLAMALVQFLDNAAKYSFAGQRVKVAAWESHAEVMISVHNFGPAIPISDREKIFQRFYRSEGSKNMAAGTGIGLSAAKMAVEVHKGHVWVISDQSEGTTFFLSLPQHARSS
jgi:two-component system, OmpR family, sensor histidine kinase KdpD